MLAFFVPVAALSVLGLCFGLGLAYASRHFLVHLDPKVEKILSLLPGANCGACGQVGCAGFAQALAARTAVIDSCAACSRELKEHLAGILGVELGEEKEKTKAFNACGGGSRAIDKFVYHGIYDCLAASMILSGPKACCFGCVGFGSCKDVCPVCAIEMKEGVAVINPDICIGCQRCVKVCPKNVLVMFPRNKAWIRCSSHDRGSEVMKVCRIGCIACAKCLKVCPVNCIDMNDNLARIDFSRCIACGKCVEVCPTKCIEGRDMAFVKTQAI